jgi:hypothetical protein
MQPVSDTANTTAPSDQPRQRVRVRRKHCHFSTYNQFGISRRDIVVGSIIFILLGAALVWGVYSFYIKGSGIGSDSGAVAVPEDSHESARFR